MTKNNNKVKTNKDMTELEAIEKCPELTDFIIRTKVKSVRKTALIIGLTSAVVAFGLGFFCGTLWTKDAIPNNVVQIQVGETASTEGK